MNHKEIARRRQQFLACLVEQKLDYVVLVRPEDGYYFTGYTGSDAVVVFAVRSGKGWLLTDSRYTEEAEKTTRDVEVLLWKGSLGTSVGKLLRKLRGKNIGYTPGSMTVDFFNRMQATASVAAVWQEVEAAISGLRSIKSRAEVKAIRAALDCQQRAFLTARQRWQPGMTEIEVKNDLEWEMRRSGADATAFETIVAVGANASLPHAHAGRRKIQPGKMLLIDFGAGLNHYCADMTRTLWCSSIPAQWEKRYLAVLAAQQAGMEAIRAGVAGTIPHQAAVEVFARHRLADKFTHGLGHGVGLVVHENPRLSAGWKHSLQEGNVVTVEPGVYFPGAGGIRVEDMVLVTRDGYEVLSSLPKDLDTVVF